MTRMVTTSKVGIGALIERARVTAVLSQRVLAELADVPEPALARTIVGDRNPKMLATHHTVAPLSGVGTGSDRVQHACSGSGVA